MSGMNMDERGELIDLVAQAVIDKIEERDRISGLANLVVARVLALQAEEAALRAKEHEARLAESESKPKKRRSTPKTAKRV